jgi:hypothetical protein
MTNNSWESLLDGRFACQVRRLDSAPNELALLVVMDGAAGVLVLSETVALSLRRAIRPGRGRRGGVARKGRGGGGVLPRKARGAGVMNNPAWLAIWTIYDNPRDHPGWYVARASLKFGPACRSRCRRITSSWTAN